MSTIEVTDANFQDTIDSNKLVLVDIWAPWCGPCRSLAPTLEEVAKENPNVLVVKINQDENTRTSQNYGVSGLPTMLLFKNGELVDRLMGNQPKQAIINKLERYF